jgi:hypothetical protein
VATLRGGSFTGRGGTWARGIRSNSPLTAENVTMLGQNGTGNCGLSVTYSTADVTQSVLEGADNSIYRTTNSTVTVSNSRLVGGAASAGVTCVAVSRGTTFNASGCP